MKEILKKNSFFLLPYALFLLAGGVLLASVSKASLHITVNGYHHAAADQLFYYLTYLGDGVTVTILVIVLLFVKIRYSLLMGAANLIAAGITQSLKHFVFDDILRPKEFFKDVHELYFIAGVENYSYYSFPSGHTTAAFALCASLAVITDNRILKFIFLCLALSIGFSRVYLSQHFFMDIYAGSFIGTAVTMGVCYFIERYRHQHPGSWLERPLLRNR